MALTEKLSAIGDAIRAKTGSSELLTLDDMATEIAAIETGGEYGKLCADDYLEEGYIKAVLDLPGSMNITLRFHMQYNQPCSVDWGDGSTATYPYQDGMSAAHTYASGGIYVIKIPVTKDITLGLTASMSFYSDASFTNGYYLKKLYIDSPLVYIQSIGGAGMTHCEIKRCSNIYSKAFYSCSVLGELVIPEGLTSLQGSVFSDCYSLYKVVIPKTVTSIASGAFNYCYRLRILDFSHHESVPTLSSASSIYNVTGQKILVPAALYDEWIAATNWTSFADKIVAV